MFTKDVMIKLGIEYVSPPMPVCANADATYMSPFGVPFGADPPTAAAAQALPFQGYGGQPLPSGLAQFPGGPQPPQPLPQHFKGAEEIGIPAASGVFGSMAPQYQPPGYPMADGNMAMAGAVAGSMGGYGSEGFGFYGNGGGTFGFPAEAMYSAPFATSYGTSYAPPPSTVDKTTDVESDRDAMSVTSERLPEHKEEAQANQGSDPASPRRASTPPPLRTIHRQEAAKPKSIPSHGSLRDLTIEDMKESTYDWFASPQELNASASALDSQSDIGGPTAARTPEKEREQPLNAEAVRAEEALAAAVEKAKTEYKLAMARLDAVKEARELKATHFDVAGFVSNYATVRAGEWRYSLCQAVVSQCTVAVFRACAPHLGCERLFEYSETSRKYVGCRCLCLCVALANRASSSACRACCAPQRNRKRKKRNRKWRVPCSAFGFETKRSSCSSSCTITTQ